MELQEPTGLFSAIFWNEQILQRGARTGPFHFAVVIVLQVIPGDVHRAVRGRGASRGTLWCSVPRGGHCAPALLFLQSPGALPPRAPVSANEGHKSETDKELERGVALQVLSHDR